MEYRKLGTADIEVSVMGLGCWPFAGGTIWGEQDEDESIATVHAALDAGINFFDTAEGYEEGRSERVLGRGLASRRQRAVIASKVSPDHLTPEGIAVACERSLKNLRTDYIDLYQIHWPNHGKGGDRAKSGICGLRSRECGEAGVSTPAQSEERSAGSGQAHPIAPTERLGASRHKGQPLTVHPAKPARVTGPHPEQGHPARNGGVDLPAGRLEGVRRTD